MSARAEWLVVGGSPEPWERLGLTVVDGAVPLFGTGLRFDAAAEPGIAGWALSGLADEAVTDIVIDGLVTAVVAPATPTLVEHPNGAIGLDHVVVTTNDLERTCAAVEAATGAPLRRVREVGEIRQGFHRLGGGGLIVEVVERAGLPVAPALVLGPRHQRRGSRRRRPSASGPTASAPSATPCSRVGRSPRSAPSSASACPSP